MTNEEKKRLISVLTKAGLIIGIGVLYALFVFATGWGIPCVFYKVTDLYCPGCGISRMFLCLLQLDFAGAARYNLLVLCLLPFALVLLVSKAWQYVKRGTATITKAEKVFYCIAFVLCIVFSILRNTDAIPFLIMP